MRSQKVRVLAAAMLLAAGSLHAQEGVPSDEALEVLRRMALHADTAVPPIKIAASARTFKDIEREYLAWGDRVFVQPALARIAARGEVPWAEEARSFVKSTVRVLFTARDFEAKDFQPQAQELVKTGCDDPAVLILAAYVNMKCEVNRVFVSNCAELALKKLAADPGIPAVLWYHAHGLMTWVWQEGGYKTEPGAERLKAIGVISRMASDASFEPAETELFLLNLASQEFLLKPHADKVRDLAPKLPLPLWAQQTILGNAELDLAWNARGSGWAAAVTPEGWKGFEEHLTEARTALVRAWKWNPKCPIAATRMITVVMAAKSENGETERLWFDRAIAAQCDYAPAYEAMLWAYRPRWAGSHELMLAFGKACLAIRRFDLRVPSYFTRATKDIASEIGDWRAFYRRPDIARALMDVTEGFFNEPSRAKERPMWQSYLAVNAWMTGDNARAAAELAKIGGPLDPDCLLKLRSHGVAESEMREDIAVANSPIAADFKEAVALYENKNLAEAEQLFRKIEPSAPEAVHDGLRERLLVIDIERRLATGGWVQLPVDAGLHGWLRRSGDWSGTADGTLVNKGSDAQGDLIHRARVGPDFEMRLKFSVAAKEQCCRGCDILFGWRSGFQEPYNSACYRQAGKGSSAARFATTYSKLPWEKKQITYKQSNTLLLHSSGGKLTFTVNGQPAFTDYSHENLDFGPPDGRVGVGHARWCRKNVTRITKIEVRRLGTEAN